MENSSKKYKVYLIVLAVFAVISFIFGYFTYNEAVNQKKNFDDIYEIVKNGNEEDSQKIVDEINKSAKDENQKKSKEEILKILDETKKGEVYAYLESGRDQEVISIYSMQLLCLLHGYMILVVLLLFIENRFLKSLNKVLKVILNVVAVILFIPAAPQFVPIGAIALPIAIIYCVYKMIKLKKNNKNDGQEEVVEVMGKVDADKVFNKDNK